VKTGAHTNIWVALKLFQGVLTCDFNVKTLTKRRLCVLDDVGELKEKVHTQSAIHGAHKLS
jgi:hypothetical protein